MPCLQPLLAQNCSRALNAVAMKVPVASAAVEKGVVAVDNNVMHSQRAVSAHVVLNVARKAANGSLMPHPQNRRLLNC